MQPDKILISSVQNPKIKDAVRLKEKRARKTTGLTLVDGARETWHALKVGAEMKEVFVCPEYLQRHQNKELLKMFSRLRTPLYEVTPPVYDKVSFGERKDGVVAVCKPLERKFADLKPKNVPLFVVVENVEKPGNLGAILRTCDAAGADALLSGDTQTDIFNPNVIRASIGTVFHVPVVQDQSAGILDYLKKQDIKIVATLPLAPKAYTAVDLKGPLALVVGSEERGLSPFWVKHADEHVRIPMTGIADSLNVSVSAAILLYEALRQRGEAGR